MSTNAQTIVEQIRVLPPDEQREILEALQRPRAPGKVKHASKRRGRGLFKDSGLLEALLAERAKERVRA